MAFENNQKVTEALLVLQVALCNLLLKLLKGRYGQHWWQQGVTSVAVYEDRIEAAKQEGGTPDDWFRRFDVLTLIYITSQHWHKLVRQNVKDKGLPTYCDELRTSRKLWAHPYSEEMSYPEAAKAVNLVSLSLKAIYEDQQAARVEQLLLPPPQATAKPIALPITQKPSLRPYLIAGSVVLVGVFLYFILPEIIDIINPPPPPPPTSSFSIESPKNGTSSNTSMVTFIPEIHDAGDITGYYWNFGDGTESREKSPSHTYDATGTYTVSLLVDGQGFTTDPYIIQIAINSIIPAAACVPGTPLPALVKAEHPVIILTRESEFIVHNELFKALEAAGFVVIEPRLLAKIQDSPVVKGVYDLDCDSMASLAQYLNSYILVAPQIIIEDLGNNPQGYPVVQATVQVNAYNPRTGQVLFGDFDTIPRYSNTRDAAEREAMRATAQFVAALLGEKLPTYYR